MDDALRQLRAPIRFDAISALREVHVHVVAYPPVYAPRDEDSANSVFHGLAPFNLVSARLAPISTVPGQGASVKCHVSHRLSISSTVMMSTVMMSDRAYVSRA